MTDAERDEFIMQCASNARATLDQLLADSGLVRGTHDWCKASHFDDGRPANFRFRASSPGPDWCEVAFHNAFPNAPCSLTCTRCASPGASLRSHLCAACDAPGATTRPQNI